MIIEVYKETTDNFYPNYTVSCMEVPAEPKFVRVRFSKLQLGGYRVACWGGDDFGMSRDFEEFAHAKEYFSDIIFLEQPITIFQLRQWNFERF